MYLIKHFTNWKIIKSIISTTVTTLGSLDIILSLALVSGITSISTKNSINFGFIVLAFSCIGFIIAVLKHWPIRKIKYKDKKSDAEIVVKVGDIFKEDGNIAIGMSDCFDTQVGEIISQSSLQGKLVNEYFSGDSKRLDKIVNQALKNTSTIPVTDKTKKKGKKNRYPIGTTICLPLSQRMIFACAYSQMSSGLVATSSVSQIWNSLNKLWITIREKGELKEIAVPALGTKLARTNGGITYTNLVKMILISYILEYRSQKISSKMTLVVYKDDADKLDFFEISEFLNQI